MKNKYIKYLHILLCTVFVILWGCQQASNHSAAPVELNTNPFAGLWTLHIMELQDPQSGEYHEWRDGLQGYLLYDNTDNMSVHLTTKGYQDTDLVFPNFNDTISLDALKHLTKSYVYFAKYSVDEANQTVQHARISHHNPTDWNKVVTRKYSFLGDTLVLEPVENTFGKLRLKWVRESEI